jgi:hypothetical protein
MAEENVFEQMAQEGTPTAEEPAQPVVATGEVDFNKLSNVAVGEKVKYDRVDLNGQTVVIKSAQLFNADPENDEAEKSMNGNTEYYRNTFIIHYDTPNEDGEYYSGVRQFKQRDGSVSEHNFWYSGSNSQAAALWEAVAKFKNKKAEELSAREFLAFLNTKPKAKIAGQKFQFPGQPEVTKNIVTEFVA